MAAILVGEHDCRTQFWKRTIQWLYSIKAWFQLSNWFQTRRFLCEFPIGSYVKLSSAVGAILVEGPNRRTKFWKRTIQWLFHQTLFLLSKGFQTRRFLWEFPIGSFVKLSSAVAAILVGVLKCRTILEENHPRIISAKFGWDWLSSFRGEEFFLISSPLFSNLHNRSK